MDETGADADEPQASAQEPEAGEPYGQLPSASVEDLPLMVLRLLDVFDERRRSDRASLRKADQALDERVALIEAYLDSQEDKQPEPPPVPQPFRGRASEQDWGELVDWVDWLLATYQPTNEHRIAPCWPAHDGAVEHLCGLHHAWRAAMLKDEHGGPNDAAAYWHKNFLWPVLSDVSRMIPNQCATSGHTRPRPPEPTDRSLIANLINTE
jgi:hypothetical protein